MAIDLATLQARYLDSCKRQEVHPNSTVLLGFSKVELQKSRHEPCSLQVFLDKLNDVDFAPLINLFPAIDLSEIDAVDILHGSPSILNGEFALSLMRAVNHKLRIVELHDLSFGKDFLRDIFCHGLTCQILNLRFSHIRKLNMIGEFMKLHTLNLDFSISLTGLREDCFSCMPNLMRISMCETRISNLWTTSAALSKLPSLLELRFQNCLCCNDTGSCSTSSSDKPNPLASGGTWSDLLGLYSHSEKSSSNLDLVSQNSQYSRRREEEILRDLFLDNLDTDSLDTTEESLDDGEVEQRTEFEELPSDLLPELARHAVRENEDNSVILYAPHHPSPICFERHYREYMIASLPRLKVLDNMSINDKEREIAKVIFSQYYEYCPYNRQRTNNLVSVLQKREMGAIIGHLPWFPNLKQSYPLQKSQHFFSRSICAAKVGSSPWPLLHRVSKFSSVPKEQNKILRPRQFEYHPSDSSLMVFGTLDGEIVVTNHERGRLVGYVPSRGTLSCVLGISWLRKNPSKVKQLLAVDGRIHLKFEIASTGSAHNYTRSYYMNGRDYIISGSSDEHVVRICCAQTGRRLRDVALESRGTGNAMFVQSLRGDPFRDFHMSVLAATSSKSEIIKVNLMASKNHDKVRSYHHQMRSSPSAAIGG